jgi:hypothetical protein
MNTCGRERPARMRKFTSNNLLFKVFTKSFILWNITPTSSLKVDRCFRGTYHLHLQGRRISQTKKQHEAELAICFILVSYLAYSSALNMEATPSSETSVDFQRTSRHHNHLCENLKSTHGSLLGYDTVQS